MASGSPKGKSVGAGDIPWEEGLYLREKLDGRERWGTILPLTAIGFTIWFVTAYKAPLCLGCLAVLLIGACASAFLLVVECEYARAEAITEVEHGGDGDVPSLKAQRWNQFWRKVGCLGWIHVFALPLAGVCGAAALCAMSTAFNGVALWRTAMDFVIALSTILTLGIAILTWLVSRRVKDIEEQHAQSRKRATAVWHLVDDAMRHGYELQDQVSEPTIDQVWKWIFRFGVFSYHALGYHAYRVVFMNYWSKDRLDQKVSEGAQLRKAIQLVLNNVYDHNFDKVADGRIRRDFDVTVWRDWTPALPIPAGVKEVAPPVPPSES